MATYVKLCPSAVIMALFIIISSATAAPSGSQDIDIDIDIDIEVATQEMENANYFTFVMLINMVPPNLFQGNLTFLMPNDRSLSRTIIPQDGVVDFLLRHSIPSPLLFDHLLHLPTNTMLPTSNPELMLKVSNGGRRRLFLGNVRIVSPNICTRGDSVRCHGISEVLSLDLEKPEPACHRAASPIPAAAPSLPVAPPPNEPSGGRPQMELASTCMAFAFAWVGVCLI